MRTIELCVDYLNHSRHSQTGTPYLRYEWFGLKDQRKRTIKYVYLEDEE